MNRRKFIELNGWLFGFTVAVGSSSIFLNSCKSNSDETSKSLIGEKDAEFLNELSEIIIPKTDSPGAKETNPGQYIVLIHNDCLTEDEQISNKEHLKKLKQLLKIDAGNEIISLKKPETISLIKTLDNQKNESFRLYKNLIVSAYLSSELGSSKFLKFSLVPGRYDGCTANRPW